MVANVFISSYFRVRAIYSRFRAYIAVNISDCNFSIFFLLIRQKRLAVSRVGQTTWLRYRYLHFLTAMNRAPNYDDDEIEREQRNRQATDLIIAKVSGKSGQWWVKCIRMCMESLEFRKLAQWKTEGLLLDDGSGIWRLVKTHQQLSSSSPGFISSE